MGRLERIAGAIAAILAREGLDYAQSKAVFKLARQRAGLTPPPDRRGSIDRLTLEEELRFIDQAYAKGGRTGLMLQALLETGARVSELRFEPDEIELRIQHPTPRGENERPAPYGDKSFDEYGIADSDWWYPRDEASFGCVAGVPLETVHLQFLNAYRGERLEWAWFSCSTAYSNGRNGVWHLVPSGPS